MTFYMFPYGKSMLLYNYAFLMQAVHHYFQRLREANMAHEVGLLNVWHGIEKVGAEDTFASVVVYREVADAERG